MKRLRTGQQVAGQGRRSVRRAPVIAEPLNLEVSKSELEGSGSKARKSLPRRILVVDDNKDSAESLSLFLSMVGNEVRMTHEGLQALEEAAAFQPNAVVLDIGLPKLNGYEVARRIREQPWGRSLVLIALTGWDQEEDRYRALEAGFDHYLTKPVDPNVLPALLDSHQ